MESLSDIYSEFKVATGISIDTRTIRQGEIFFALSGPNFDGNQFAKQAIQKGAKMAVVDDPELKEVAGCYIVDHVLQALQELAQYHRRQLEIPIIAITGSNGKTTTKELVFEVLRTSYKTFATNGNLNNHIGVPISLLSIPLDAQMAIIEMGASKQGEIKELCEIAEPTHGMITNIGKAHLEGFGDRTGVLNGKTELYHHLAQRQDGVAFVDGTQQELMERAKQIYRIVTYGSEQADYSCQFLEANPYLKINTAEQKELMTHLSGAYHYKNVAAALCIGQFFDVIPEFAHKAISAYVPQNNRNQWVKKKGLAILMDAYNANPDSVAAALQNFDALKEDHKVVVLADMAELGTHSKKEHQQIGELLAGMSFEKILLCGEKMFYASEKVPGSLHFANRTILQDYLEEIELPKNSVVLLKGSRSMALEKLVDFL